MSFFPEPVNMSVEVFESPAINQVFLAIDSYSRSHGNQDGIAECGDRTYTIDANVGFLTLSGDTLALESTDLADVTTEPLIVTVTAKLVDFPS